MAGIVANIGKPGTDASVAQFPPPPRSGFYKIKLGTPRVTEVPKADPVVQMIQMQCTVLTDVHGAKVPRAFAGYKFFNVAPDKPAAIHEKYRSEVEAARLRNLLEIGFEQAGNERLKKQAVELDVDSWKDATVWAKVSVVEEKDQSGAPQMVGRVEYCVTEEQARIKSGILSSEPDSLTSSDAPAGAEGTDDEIPTEAPKG